MVDPQQRAEFINREEYNLVQNAFRQGKSPAEILYTMAQTRGWKPAPKEQAQAQSEPLQAQRTAQQRANPMADAGQSGNFKGVTYETLANMDEDQLYDLAKANPQAYKKLMSGL